MRECGVTAGTAKEDLGRQFMLQNAARRNRHHEDNTFPSHSRQRNDAARRLLVGRDLVCVRKRL